MNKTINVNIGGRIFSIEEDAYAKLNRYLEAIRGYFDRHRSADEIISDIELRISELFEERISDSKQVIVLNDVDEVISIMGKPEDYVDMEDEEETADFREPGRRRYEKRVFRDPDDKILFGVCGGLSAYVGWDPIILRALFVIFTIAWGIGPLIYIILALIIPKAKTTAEKLQMRGEPVTVENISKKVNESFNDIKDDLKSFGDRNDINSERVNNFGRQVGDVVNDFFEALGKVLKVLIVVLAKIIGVLVFILGAFGLTFLLAAVLGWENFMTAGSSNELAELMNASFSDGIQRGLFYAGISLFLGIPAVLLILLGIRLLSDRMKFSGLAAIILVVAWFVGIGLLAASGFNAYQDIRVEASYTEKVNLNFPPTDTLVLDIEGADLPRYEFSDDFFGGKVFFDGLVTIPGVDSTNIVYVGENEVTVRRSLTENYYLEVEKTARGASQKDAVANAKSMKSSLSISGDTLRILPYFVLEKGSKIRGQEAEYTLHVPLGKAIYFAPRSKEIIHDIPNTTNTWDRDMIGKTWLMTQEGLSCVSCPSSETDKSEEPDTWEKRRKEEKMEELEEEKLEEEREEEMRQALALH